MSLIAGVDEVGRGPLAGPVVAAAVILDPRRPISGIADSKKLTAARRERLAPLIQENCVAWALGRAEVHEIDELNILRATLLAMQRAVLALAVVPDLVQVDGREKPILSIRVEAIIGGDATIEAISAASIVAKVARDREMGELDKQYPGYGFAQHKGYGTQQHMLALKQLGACPIHRRSFSPVAAVLARERLSCR